MIDAEYLTTLADAIISSGLRKRYVMYARVDTIEKNRTLVEKWATAGLEQLWIGLEGSTNAQLEAYRKKNTTRSQQNAIGLARSLGVDVHATAMVNQTFHEADFSYMLDYTKGDLGLTSCHFFILTPFRGSIFYEQLFRESPEVFLTQNPDNFSIMQSVTKPEHMSIEEFHRCYADLQRKFNSDTIPFEYNETFKNKQNRTELEMLKEKNEKLYGAILTSDRRY